MFFYVNKSDDIFSYNPILDFIERDNLDFASDTEQRYRFCCITVHQGRLCTSNKDYKGSTYNVLVEWESGEITYQLLDLIGNIDPVTCAEYAMHSGLLDMPGWKQFWHLVKLKRRLNKW
jgi:hypothetical protein